MQVRLLSRTELENGGAEGVDAVISIQSSLCSTGSSLNTALLQATRGESARLLRLSFDDIGIERYGSLIGPTMAQITDAVEFGRHVAYGDRLFDRPSVQAPLIAIHSEHGKSRSAALALALLADDLGDGRERDAVNMLLRSDHESKLQPNSLAISLADACLFRYGRINSALAELCPRYVWQQTRWRLVTLAPDEPCANRASEGRLGLDE